MPRRRAPAAELLAAAVAAGRVSLVSSVGVRLPAPTVIDDARRSSITEAEFQAMVIDLAHACGWLVAHFAPARVIRRGVEKYETPVRGDGRGFPDLVLARLTDGVPRVLLVELKTDTGRLSEHQKRWLRESGASVWRPGDWEEIRRVLA